MKFSLILIGELRPDFVSECIQEFLTDRHGLEVNWSHAALLVEDAEKYSGIWESTGKGFAQNTLAGALDKSVIRHQIELNVAGEWAAIGWLKGFKGTAYSTAQYLLFVPKWMRWIGSLIFPAGFRKIVRNGKARSFCSESMAHFIRDNCKNAEDDPGLSIEACDEIDPYLVKAFGEKYRKV